MCCIFCTTAAFNMKHNYYNTVSAIHLSTGLIVTENIQFTFLPISVFSNFKSPPDNTEGGNP